MRKFASAATLFALGFALGACGGSSSSSSGTTSGTKSTTTETTQTTSTQTTSAGTTSTQTTTGGVPATWSGPPQPGKDGSIAIDGFNEWAKAHLPAAKRQPRSLAVEFLRPSGDYTVDVGRAIATVVRDNLEDDSVRTIRYELIFGLLKDGTWILRGANAAYKCQQGRGHQQFSPELCV